MKKKILAICPHADDIELNFASTLIKYRKEYDYTIGYIMTTDNASGGVSFIDQDGNLQTTTPPAAQMQPIRQSEANTAAQEAFHTEAIHLNYPQRHYTNTQGDTVELRYGVPGWCSGAESVPSILTAYEDQAAVEHLRDIILDFDPEVIITMTYSDTNPEHVCTGLLALRAFRAAQKEDLDATLPHAMPPAPFPIGAYYNGGDTFVDTTGYYDDKIRAICYHRSQKPDPTPLDLRDFDEGARFGCVTAERFTVGELSKVTVGPLTVEIRKNHRTCLEMPLWKLIHR